MTEVRPARDADEVRAALALRHEVFVVEQGVPLEEEIDDHDETDALHLVAVEPDGRIVATARLVAEGETVKLGRVAVAAAARRRGIASRLLAEGEARAGAQFGARRIALAAQTDALPLYERAGYAAYGARFMDAGIEHQMMEKQLPRAAAS
jgi:ElaA protein